MTNNAAPQHSPQAEQEARMREAIRMAWLDSGGSSDADRMRLFAEACYKAGASTVAPPDTAQQEAVAWIVSGSDVIPYPHIERLVDVGKYPAGTRLYADKAPVFQPAPDTAALTEQLRAMTAERDTLVRQNGEWQALSDAWKLQAIKFQDRAMALERAQREPVIGEWPECEAFYNLMQAYRHSQEWHTLNVVDTYEAVKTWLIASFPKAASGAVGEPHDDTLHCCGIHPGEQHSPQCPTIFGDIQRADQFPRAGVAAGWVMVPEDATAAMLDAAERIDWTNEDTRASCINQWTLDCADQPAPSVVTWQRAIKSP